jgi:hypothetical protein
MAAPTFSVNDAMLHAIAFIKGPSTYASSEELRFANTISTEIVSFYPWHWSITDGTDIAVSSGTQDYSMAAGDQNAVLAIHQANLLEGSTEQDELLISSEMGLPLTSTTGQPLAVAMISPTQVRFHPTPDATYTFQWRYHARATIHQANTESFDVPLAFNDVVKAGMIWQVLSYADDDRDEAWQTTFYNLLAEHRRREQMAYGRRRF